MIRNYEIERYYNRDREKDVPYTYINNISASLQLIIKEILINKKK